MSVIKQLTPGTPVQICYLNRVHKPTNLNLIYIGLIENDCIILRWRAQDNPQQSINELESGVQISVKTLVKKDLLLALTFRVSSLGVSVLREPLLLLEYPSNVNAQPLRHDKRLPVELMANIELVDSHEQYLALVSDMSVAGLRCEYMPSEQEMSEGNYRTVKKLVGQKVNIQFVTDDDLDLDLTLHGEIRNIKIKEKVNVGIQFLTEDLEVIKNVFAIVLMRSHGM